MHASSSTPILIVDDFEDALDMYRESLTFNGYQVLTARSAQAAIDIVRTQHPAVIFMDLRMPGMNGTEALSVLRKDPTLLDVPIVAFTAHALDNERSTAVNAGFDEVIAKPCLPDELMSAVERLIAKSRETS
jgi:CheY-like chemotaxis protein